MEYLFLNFCRQNFFWRKKNTNENYALIVFSPPPLSIRYFSIIPWKCTIEKFDNISSIFFSNVFFSLNIFVYFISKFFLCLWIKLFFIVVLNVCLFVFYFIIISDSLPLKLMKYQLVLLLLFEGKNDQFRKNICYEKIVKIIHEYKWLKQSIFFLNDHITNILDFLCFKFLRWIRAFIILVIVAIVLRNCYD